MDNILAYPGEDQKIEGGSGTFSADTYNGVPTCPTCPDCGVKIVNGYCPECGKEL
ncbi:MAG: hypothetical protein PHQ42_03850 [Patescibacteria group bacterium]|nr:hypothetical protein [Patescibacteria group bacterium]